MLWKLLVEYLRPNADIIDDGVATGDTGVILRLGALMLGITLQLACAIIAVYFAAKAAMGVARVWMLFLELTGSRRCRTCPVIRG